jgi:integrase
MPYVRSTRHPELYKRGAVWWGFIPNPAGRRLRESSGLSDERAAYGWWLARVAVANGSAPAPDPSTERTLGVALASRIEWLRAGRLNDDPSRRKLSEATIDFYDGKSAQLIRVLGRDTPLSKIGHEQIRKYIVTRTKGTEDFAPVKGTTIAKELVTLGMAMRLARKDGITCSDFRDIKPEGFSSSYVPKTRWLAESEVDALIAVLPPHRAAVVAFIVATSATNPSEVTPVRPGDVNEKTGAVHLKGTKRATRDRTLRVPSHARKYLKVALAGLGPAGFEPWVSIRRDLHRAADLLSLCEPCRAARFAWARHEDGAHKIEAVTGCKACAKVPRFARLSPNDLRRTFAQWLVRSGVPYELAYPLMGHGSPAMLTKVYGKRDATAVADLVELALKRAPKGARKAG